MAKFHFKVQLPILMFLLVLLIGIYAASYILGLPAPFYGTRVWKDVHCPAKMPDLTIVSDYSAEPGCEYDGVEYRLSCRFFVCTKSAI